MPKFSASSPEQKYERYNYETLAALSLAKSKRFSDVNMASFLRLGRKIDVDETWMRERVELHRHQILDGWIQSRDGFDFAPEGPKRLEAHLTSVPIFR